MDAIKFLPVTSTFSLTYSQTLYPYVTRVGKPLFIYNLFPYKVKVSCDCAVRHHVTSSERDQLR